MACCVTDVWLGWPNGYRPPASVPSRWTKRDGAMFSLSLSLSRLAVHPDEPQNAASLLIGRSIRLIRRARRWAALVTFADDSQGHEGTIYKATNWSYVGRTKPYPRWVSADGRQVAVLATKSRTKAEMLALGYSISGNYAKHKFVYVLR